MTKLRKPCDNCPWRVDAPREYWDPSHFTSIWQNCQDDGMHLMMCHKSNNLPKGTPSTEMPICQGWIRVMGFTSIGVRIAAMNGRVSFEEVGDTTSVELFPTFEAMLRANKIPILPRNRSGDVVAQALLGYRNTEKRGERGESPDRRRVSKRQVPDNAARQGAAQREGQDGARPAVAVRAAPSRRRRRVR